MLDKDAVPHIGVIAASAIKGLRFGSRCRPAGFHGGGEPPECGLAHPRVQRFDEDQGAVDAYRRQPLRVRRSWSGR